jgi:hypothetical protein
MGGFESGTFQELDLLYVHRLFCAYVSFDGRGGALVCGERGEGWAVSLGIYSTRSPVQKPGKKVILHVKILKSCIWSYCTQI